MVSKVQESWVDCVGSTSSVFTLGHGTWNSLEMLDSRELVLIIPGNPGCSSMLQDFMSGLYNSLGKPELSIWAFSYIGHESQCPSLLPMDRTYILEDQIQHKLELMEKLIPRTAKITLIGYSIGCKIIMEMFKRNTTHTIHEIFFLFPAIENMNRTRNGQIVYPMVNIFRHLALLVVFIVSLIPSGILHFIIRQIFRRSSANFISASAKLVNPNHVNNVMVLARDELNTVLELDVDTIKKMAGKLHLYYAEKDGWAPLSFRENLLREVPELGTDNARIDTNGIPHTFAVKDGRRMGKIIAEWIKEEEKMVTEL